MQGAVDVLDHEVDRVRRQGLATEEDVEHALVGMDRRGVVEVAVIAAVERRAEREQRIGDQHEADRDADRPEQHAERAWTNHFVPDRARAAARLGRLA